MKTVLGWMIVSAMALATESAWGQTPAPVLGDPGHVAVSAERLFGFVHANRTLAGEPDRSIDTFSLFSNPLLGVYSWPRIGFDGFMVRGLSVGASASFFTASQDNVSVSGFALAPRFGVAVPLTPQVAIWLRAGVTFVSISSGASEGSSTTQSFFALTLEAPFAIRAAPRVFVLAAPTLDLGLAGRESSPGGTGRDTKVTEFGFEGGLMALF